MKNKVLGIITAKGQSRGLPNKNLHSFCGKPLIWWTIKAAKNSKYITKTVVSSECSKILTMSRGYGVDTVERPKELARDNTTSASVIKQVVNYLRDAEGYSPEILVLLQPTSPLRSEEDIDNALELYFQSSCSAVISGYKLQRNPLKDFLLNEDGTLSTILDDGSAFLPRQELPQAFRPNGAIYIIDAPLFMQTQTLLTNNTKPFFMEKERSIDIDNIKDLKTAESHLSKL